LFILLAAAVRWHKLERVNKQHARADGDEYNDDDDDDDDDDYGGGATAETAEPCVN